MKRSRSGSGITLRDRDKQSSLTIHVCFLRETVFVGTNHPNMEETGSLENPFPSGKCYQGHRIKIGGLGRMANSAFGGKLNLCSTSSHLFTRFVVALVVDNKYNVYVR